MTSVFLQAITVQEKNFGVGFRKHPSTSKQFQTKPINDISIGVYKNILSYIY